MNKTEDLSGKTLDGVLWILIESGGESFVAFISIMIVARLVSPEAFGTFAIASLVISFFYMLSAKGIQKALVQKEEFEEEDITTGFTLILIFGFLVFLIIYFSSNILANFFEMAMLSVVLPVMGLKIVIDVVSDVSNAIAERKLEFKKIALINFTAVVGGALIVRTTFAYFDFGIWALVMGTLTQVSINTILFLTVFPHKLKFSINWHKLKEILKYNYSWLIGAIFNFGATQGDYLVIGRVLDPHSLGIYERAYKLMAKPANLFGKALKKVLFPTFSKIKKSKKRLERGYIRGMTLMTFFLVPLTVIVYLLAEEIILIVLGEQWIEAVGVFKILAIAMYFRIGYKIHGSILKATAKLKEFAIVQGIYSVLIVGGSYLASEWGVLGIALVVLLSIAFTFMMFYTFTLKIIKFSQKQLIKDQLPVLIVLLLVLLTLPFLYYLREFNLHFSIRFILFFGTNMFLWFIFILFAPHTLKGKHVAWLNNEIKNYGLSIYLKWRNS